MIKEVEQEDIQLMNDIRTYKNVSKKEVELIEYFMKKYVDKKTNICKRCPSQIRFAFRRCIIWISRYLENQVSKTLKCVICNKELTGRQKKYCSNSCKANK